MSTRSRFPRIKAINQGKLIPEILGCCGLFDAVSDGIEAGLGARCRRAVTVGVELGVCPLFALHWHVFRRWHLRHLRVGGLQAVSEERHQVKVLSFQVDSFAFQIVVDYSLLFPDNLGASGDLLKKDLHHVHLADGEAMHLREVLGNLCAVFWRL